IVDILSSLFPYTTLFRSFEQLFSNSIVLFDKQWKTYECFWRDFNTFDGSVEDLSRMLDVEYDASLVAEQHEFARSFDYDAYIERSEEHTSELQSRFDLVC